MEPGGNIMKIIINITADPSELMAISRELAGNMKDKPDIDVLSAAIDSSLRDVWQSSPML